MRRRDPLSERQSSAVAPQCVDQRSEIATWLRLELLDGHAADGIRDQVGLDRLLDSGPMTLRDSGRRMKPRGLSVAGLLLTLAGLFGMHGLDNHGVPTPAMMSVETTHTGAGVPHSLSDLATLTSPSGVPPHARAESHLRRTAFVAGIHAGHGMPFMAGMCLATLVAAIMALLRSMWRREPQRYERHPWAPLLGLTASARSPDPPSLFWLSIQRC